MRFMASYDFMETLRTTNQWFGATAQALGSYPAASMTAIFLIAELIFS